GARESEPGNQRVHRGTGEPRSLDREGRGQARGPRQRYIPSHLDELSGPEGRSLRERERGIRECAEDPRPGSNRHRLHGRRNCPRRLRRIGEVRKGTNSVLETHRGAPSDTVHARGHGDSNRRCSYLGTTGRLAPGPRPPLQKRSGDGEVVRERDVLLCDEQGRSDPWRLWVHRGLSGGTDAPRCKTDGNWRRHQRDSAHGDRPRIPRRLTSPFVEPFKTAGPRAASFVGSYKIRTVL